MANKNFEIKNGLTVAGTERITAAGAGSLTDLTLSGNLTVNGTTVTLDASTLQVADKNIVLNYHASNDTSSAANGAGITIQDAVDGSNNATILWDATNDEFDFSHNISSPGLLNGASNSFIYLAGGNASNGGSNILLYGQSHSSDANTTVFRAGGAETMRITSSGDILGKTADVRIGSDVGAIEYGTSTNNSTRFYTNNVERMRIQGGGNVGIGTSSPLGKLHVRDGSAQAGISHTYIYDGSAISVEGTEPAIQLMAEDSGTHGGSLLWRYGNNAFAAIANPTTDAIDFTYGVTTANDFQVHSGTNMSSYKKILSLGADGNVGIGGLPDSSGRLLVTNGGTNQIVLKGASGSTNLNMGNFVGGGYIANNYYYSSGHQADDNSKGAFEVFIGDENYAVNYHAAGAAGTRRRDFAIDSTGKVGIGTNTPTKTLSVKAPSGSNGGIDVFHSNGNKVAELVHSGSGDEGRLSLLDSGSTTVQFMGETGQNSYINSGNVGIGYASPGQKLQIAEATNYAPPGLGSNGGHFGIFKIDSGTPKYGILTGVNATGSVWQQVQRIDGVATAYNLQLQPSGGNIEIGTSANMGFAGQTAPNTPIHVGTGTSTGPRIQISHENVGGFGSLDIDAYGSATLRLISNFSGSTMNGVATGKFGLVTPHGRDIVFGTSGVERFRISAGKTGIAFNSDTAQANHLDDYEEGEVSYYGGGAPRWYGSAGAFENTGQLGGNKIFYTKIGNMVHLHGQVSWTNTGSHGGQIRVNLPFPVVSGYRGGLALGLVAGLTMGGDALTLVPETGSTVAYLIEISSGGGHTHTDASDFTANSYRVVSFAGSYTTSS